jgi:hypothetical protein
MAKSNTPLLAGGMVGIFVVIISVVLIFGGGTNFVVGNVSNLSLAENFRDLNCDAWNELAVTRNGQVVTVGSGREGFNPVFESGFQTGSLLSITDGSAEIDAMHVRLVMNCDGNFLKHPTAVKGSMSFQLCGDPQADRTTCFAGSDRTFQQLQGVAVSTQTFFDVPIQSQSLPDDEPKVIWEGDISAFELERLFQSEDGRIFFKSTMFPVLTFTINHRTLGLITASYNGITSNDPIIASYGLLRVVEDAPLDSDGDGFIDSEDGCINLAENFNGFQDDDGCPDADPPITMDTDGDGIQDSVDECVSVVGVPENNGCPAVEPCPQGLDRNEDGTCPPVVEEMDTDGDGVVDSIDDCITEVGTVANNGCPEPVIMEEMEDDQGEDEDLGTFRPPIIPPPLVEDVPPPTVSQPVTTTTPVPMTSEEEQRQFIILLLLIAGIVGIIIAGLVTRARRK